VKEMNTLDREILIALLGSHRSIYALEDSLKSTNYPTVLRRIRKLQEEELVTTVKKCRKDGKPDNRKTEIPELTPKGLATLIIEGDLEEQELKTAMIKTLQEDYSRLPANFLGDTNADKIFADTLLKMRYKINLKFFDEKYFNEVFNVSLGESIFENFKGFKTKKTIDEKQTKKLKDKYILSQTIEDFRSLQKTFENESSKFDRYSKAIGTIIQALAN
jgi:hypothetical protein